MSISHVFDFGDRVELWGPGYVMTLSGDDAAAVRGWIAEARKNNWIVENYVEYMAMEDGII